MLKEILYHIGHIHKYNNFIENKLFFPFFFLPAQHIAVKQLLTEEHSQKKMQSLESWNGDRVFSLAGLQSTRHLPHNPDLLTCRLASSESQHHEADWQRGKAAEHSAQYFVSFLCRNIMLHLGIESFDAGGVFTSPLES